MYKEKVGINNSQDDIIAERRRRTALNKKRAKEMERRVARYLNGERTPMSGSGSSKGDCVVQLVNQPGRYIIECKYTAQLVNGVDSRIRLDFKWLTKLARETEYMRAKFGILVFHYHNTREDWVLISESHLHVLDSISGTTFFSSAVDQTPFDLCFTLKGVRRSGYNLLRKHLTSRLSEKYGAGVINTPLGKYVFMTLEHFSSKLNNKE